MIKNSSGNTTKRQTGGGSHEHLLLFTLLPVGLRLVLALLRRRVVASLLGRGTAVVATRGRTNRAGRRGAHDSGRATGAHVTRGVAKRLLPLGVAGGYLNPEGAAGVGLPFLNPTHGKRWWGNLRRTGGRWCGGVGRAGVEGTV